MSGKTGKRLTAKKPETTRRHNSLAAGAFGRESVEEIRTSGDLNRKISGKPSKEHSKYRRGAKKSGV